MPPLQSNKKTLSRRPEKPAAALIEMRTFRHWGETMIAYCTNGNVLIVKRLLRHKRIENSMKYIGIIDFKDDDFETATATTPEEIKKLGQEGWTKYDEATFNCMQLHFYRKPKRFFRCAQ